MSKAEITLGKPIVRKVAKSDDKKKAHASEADGTSKGVSRITDVDKRVTKAILRATRAVEAGVDNYADRRDHSSARSKDGSVVDAFKNVASGVSKAVAEAAPIMNDVAEAVSSDQMNKSIRRVTKNLNVVPF